MRLCRKLRHYVHGRQRTDEAQMQFSLAIYCSRLRRSALFREAATRAIDTEHIKRRRRQSVTATVSGEQRPCQ